MDGEREVPAPAGELLTADMQLIDLADLWITGLEGEGRIEQSPINEYRRVLDNLVLPSVGRLKLSEITTGQLDRLLLRLQDSSVNHHRSDARHRLQDRRGSGSALEQPRPRGGPTCQP